MDVVDDDSENDSDYAPGEGDASESEHEDEVHIEEISLSRKRHMADMFSEMQSSEASMTKARVSASLMHTVRTKKKAKKASGAADPLKVSKVSKSFKTLATIFGKTEAKKMLNMKPSKKVGNTSTEAASADADADGEEGDDEDAAERMRRVRERALAVAQNTLTKAVVVDKVKFAGKEIEVQRTVAASSSGAGAGAPKKASGALDKVLSDIKGPQAISTVAKSSYDWESFKEEENLEDDLAKATKDGYLTRKDFLDRCDTRAFETEREDRLKKQVIPSGAGGI